jgi:putative ABC transport system substrate-binding protein
VTPLAVAPSRDPGPPPPRRRRPAAARGLVALVLAAGLLAAPGVALAEQPGKVWRVGFLAARQVDTLEGDAMFAPFPGALRELGYVEGRNLVIELRSAGGRYERLPELAADLVRLKVDVIVAAGAPAVAAAQKATGTIPIVMGTTGDPVGSGFVKSLARPGGNITGLSDLVGDLGAKYLDLLQGVTPRLALVAVLTHPGNRSHAAIPGSVEAAARPAGTRVLALHARSLEEIEVAFAAMTRAGAAGVIVASDPLFNQHAREIAALAARNRLPAISGYRQYVHAGGLMNYGTDFADNFRRAAVYVDKILRGARPADLPVEQPTRFELAVNLRAARALGLAVPESLLLRAAEVIR